MEFKTAFFLLYLSIASLICFGLSVCAMLIFTPLITDATFDLIGSVAYFSLAISFIAFMTTIVLHRVGVRKLDKFILKSD